MGWKTLKEKFGITHFVQMEDGDICIGSAYVSRLATINQKTGKITENPTFNSFLRNHYPALLNASAQEIIDAINKPDTFDASVTVYTFDKGDIIEKQCEVPGWPNVTHDGIMMHNNTFSVDRDKVIGWAKANIASSIEHARERITEIEQDLASKRARLAEYEDAQSKLQDNYPVAKPDRENQNG